MYDELIRSCRACATGYEGNCDNCMFSGEDCYKQLHKASADVIEDLTRENESLTRENESLAKSVNEASEILRKRWIPVTERLPGMYQQCWAACKMEGRENWVIEVQNYGIPYKKNPWGDCVLLESGEMQVYAWMPIDQPEPPKEE